MKPYLILTLEQVRELRKRNDVEAWLEARIAEDALHRTTEVRHATEEPGGLARIDYGHLCVAFVEIPSGLKASQITVKPRPAVVICLMLHAGRGVTERVVYGRGVRLLDPLVREMMLARFRAGMMPDIGVIKHHGIPVSRPTTKPERTKP